MANICAICGKKSQMVWKLKKLRGKYNPTVKKRKYPNLQWVRLPSGDRRDKSLLPPSLRSGKRVKACTKCIKAMAKRK
ncbi:MAG: L28 family ribosomal protein [bacterium]|nr:L28 family ribosomal protein [bacterium]